MYKHALQRLGILGSVGVSRDIGKKYFQHISGIPKKRGCFYAQTGESRWVEMSENVSTNLRGVGDIQVCKGRKSGGTPDMKWKLTSCRGSRRLKGKHLKL